MSKLIISNDLLDKIVSHCKSVYPIEACGILVGKNRVIESIYEMTNIENSTVSYMMDPEEQFRIMKVIRNDGNDMVAVYHSHPYFSAYPSARDVELAFYSDSAYVIVSLAEKDKPEIKAFEIVEGNVSEIKIEVRSKTHSAGGREQSEKNKK